MKHDGWVAGVDGCRGGWFVWLRHATTRELRHRLCPTFADVVALPERPLIVAVDMPIGLPDDANGRDADRAVRARMPRGKASSVFPPPPRALLARPDDYAVANAWMKRRFGKGLQKQVWNLRPKLAEVDAALTPSLQRRVREAHPEFAFALLAGRALAPKRKVAGHRERLAILRRIGFAGVEAALGAYARALVAPDDVLDAAVCCWLAGEIAAGRARPYPMHPPRDSRGLRMEIWGV